MKQTIFLELKMNSQVFFSQIEEKREGEHLQKYFVTNVGHLANATNSILETMYSQCMEGFMVFYQS